MNIHSLILAGLILLSACTTESDVAASLVAVDTQRGVSQPFLFATPEKPVAAVILFPGGDGAIGFTRLGSASRSEYGNIFLVRSYKAFVNKGLMVAVIDAPSGTAKMSTGFRVGRQHATDIMAVVDFLKKRSDVPIWLVGTSRGTYSAASVALKMEGRISGLILTSTMTRDHSEKWKDGILALNLRSFTKPVLIVAHKGDTCDVTPPANASKLQMAFSRSQRVEVAMLEGGLRAASGLCAGLSPHGFYGVENQAISRITDFIIH